jgi:hypothetical protein
MTDTTPAFGFVSYSVEKLASFRKTTSAVPSSKVRFAKYVVSSPILLLELASLRKKPQTELSGPRGSFRKIRRFFACSAARRVETAKVGRSILAAAAFQAA